MLCIAAAWSGLRRARRHPRAGGRRWQGARLGFVGRVVKDLDRSVAFYKMIGFTQDPLAIPAWRTDPVVEGLYGVKGFTTRMAKMYVVNPDSA